MANCPKCNKHLSPLNWGAKCPHCGVNIMYYDMDARLQSDADKAEAEAEHFAAVGRDMKRVTIGSPLAWVRMALFLLPILALLLPFAKGRLLGLGIKEVTGISLISIIKGLIQGAGEIAGHLNFTPDGKILIGALLLLVSIICALGALIACVFSYGKKGRGAMFGFLGAGAACTLIAILLMALGGAGFGAGSVVTIAAYVAGILGAKLIGDRLARPAQEEEK